MARLKLKLKTTVNWRTYFWGALGVLFSRWERLGKWFDKRAMRTIRIEPVSGKRVKL